MILSFELVNLDFPCGMGAVRIYQSTNTKADMEAGVYCGHSSDEDASSKLIVPFHVAVVVVSMYRFSTKHEVHLKVFSYLAVRKAAVGAHKQKYQSRSDIKTFCRCVLVNVCLSST